MEDWHFHSNGWPTLPLVILLGLGVWKAIEIIGRFL